MKAEIENTTKMAPNLEHIIKIAGHSIVSIIGYFLGFG